MKAKPEKTEMKMVLVEWMDACSDEAGWKSLKKIRKQTPMLVRSLGFVVTDHPDYLTIIGSHVPFDDTTDGDVTVPRSMIKSIKELQEIGPAA